MVSYYYFSVLYVSCCDVSFEHNNNLIPLSLDFYCISNVQRLFLVSIKEPSMIFSYHIFTPISVPKYKYVFKIGETAFYKPFSVAQHKHTTLIRIGDPCVVNI